MVASINNKHKKFEFNPTRYSHITIASIFFYLITSFLSLIVFYI